MKVALVGAGSFVFSLSTLSDFLFDHRIHGSEIALVDPNTEALDIMSGAAKAMARDAGVEVRISSFTEREKALEDCDFVILSAEVQGARRWEMDRSVLVAAGMPDQARENGGMGGLLKSFRQCTLAVNVARDMERLCPEAWLLVTSNPLPRVVSAVHQFTSIRPAGFCNAAWGGYGGYHWLANVLQRRPEDLDVVVAGLNHFSWVLGVSDRNTGEDLRPRLEEIIRAGADGDFRVLADWLERYGAVGVSGEHHMGEMLAYDPRLHYHDTPPFHGDEAERQDYAAKLVAAAEEAADWDALLEHRSWERPADVAVALNRKQEAQFDMLNLVNNGSIRELEPERIVEVPAVAGAGELKGVRVPQLPEPLAHLLRQVSNVIELSARAAIEGNWDLARQVIDIDPAIDRKKDAQAVLEEMVKLHSDLLPQFGPKAV